VTSTPDAVTVLVVVLVGPPGPGPQPSTHILGHKETSDCFEYANINTPSFTAINWCDKVPPYVSPAVWSSATSAAAPAKAAAAVVPVHAARDAPAVGTPVLNAR